MSGKLIAGAPGSRKMFIGPLAERSQSLPDFTLFDRTYFIGLRTPEGLLVYNRTRSMLNNGYRPRDLALFLYTEYSVTIDGLEAGAGRHSRLELLTFFLDLVIPSDARTAPSIFSGGGHC